MMAIGAFFCFAGWKRPSIRPADPVKMTSGIGTSVAARALTKGRRGCYSLTRERAARLVERACRRNSQDLLKNLGRLRGCAANPSGARGAFTTTGGAKGKTYDMPPSPPDKDMTDRIYLRWNATAPLRPAARAAMLAALDRLGNPSSVHAEGRATRYLVETAREAVASLVGADARNVIFTSGGTEANGLALGPAIERAGHKEPFARLLVTAIEHPSVRSGGRFAQDSVEEIAVTDDGVVDLADLAGRLSQPARGPALVSIMHANNETGVLQPVA